jgi:uncharacterized membrane protein YecN with MAPEG domain
VLAFAGVRAYDRGCVNKGLSVVCQRSAAAVQEGTGMIFVSGLCFLAGAVLLAWAVITRMRYWRHLNHERQP